jgi:Zn-dependent protease
MPAASKNDIWTKIDENIIAGYTATAAHDYVRARDHYEKAIHIAVVTESALPQSKLPNKTKSDQNGAGATAAGYYGLQPPRDLPEENHDKELQMALALRSMGIAQQRAGDRAGAAATFERSAEVFQNVLGANSDYTAWCLYCAGLLSDKPPEVREVLFKRALAIYDHFAANGKDQSNNIIDCTDCLAHCLVLQGKHDEAFTTLSRCLDGIAAFPDKSKPIPPFVELTIAGLVNGGVLHKRLGDICRTTGRAMPKIIGLPSRQKQIISLAITIAFFWFLLGSPLIATAFLLLLFVHEMGHFLAAKQIGVKTTPPIFTPMGAVITLLSQPASASQEAYFALAGPAIGTVGALTAYGLGTAFGITELIRASEYAFGLNLFNLVPLAPMDGGRISMAISRKMWILGFLLYAMIGIAVIGYSFIDVPGALPPLQRLSTLPVKLFVLYWVGKGAIADLKMRGKMAAASPQYFKIPPGVRIGYTLAYFGLAAFLVWIIGYQAETVRWPPRT